MTSAPPPLSARPPSARRTRPGRLAHAPGFLARAILATTFALLGASAAPAHAYVRAQDNSSWVPLFWSDPRKALELAVVAPNVMGVTDGDLRAAAQRAVMAWSYPQISCTAVELRLGGESTDSQLSALDGKNRILMRTGTWCRDPISAPNHCFVSDAVAMTSLFSRHRPGKPTDGEIFEADIEVNALGGFQWGNLPDNPVGSHNAEVYDLASVLTHEMGHFIGLAHNCHVPNADLLLDDKGDATPECGGIPNAEFTFIHDATMYPFMDPLDVKLRTLTADDTRAACEMYPVGSAPLYQWTGAGGCALSSSARWTSERPSSQLPPILSALATALLSLRSRRPRSRKRPAAP